jgi:hypothetical protein
MFLLLEWMTELNNKTSIFKPWSYQTRRHVHDGDSQQNYSISGIIFGHLNKNQITMMITWRLVGLTPQSITLEASTITIAGGIVLVIIVC